MRIRDRLYLALDEVERTFGKPIRAIYPDAFGVTYRGRLVAYAENERGERFALLDEGREIRPVPTERRELAVGRPVRARLVSAKNQAEATEQERRRGRLWQLADHELERDRGRGR
jgi:hypothetical protein